jgi:hypothetical protein
LSFVGFELTVDIELAGCGASGCAPYLQRYFVFRNKVPGRFGLNLALSLKLMFRQDLHPVQFDNDFCLTEDAQMHRFQWD